jgi:hypothetical protein
MRDTPELCTLLSCAASLYCNLHRRLSLYLNRSSLGSNGYLQSMTPEEEDEGIFYVLEC